MRHPRKKSAYFSIAISLVPCVTLQKESLTNVHACIRNLVQFEFLLLLFVLVFFVLLVLVFCFVLLVLVFCFVLLLCVQVRNGGEGAISP